MPRLDVEPAALIRCVNGRVMFVEVDEALVDQGVHIGPLAEDENGEARLGSVADDAGDYFTLLNDAFMDRPLLIDIPEVSLLIGRSSSRTTQPVPVAPPFLASSSVWPRTRRPT